MFPIVSTVYLMMSLQDQIKCPSEDCVSKKAKQISSQIILSSGAVCGLFKNDNE